MPDLEAAAPRRAGRPHPAILVSIALTLSIVAVVGRGGARHFRAGQVEHVVQLAERLRDACRRYHADTGRYAYEYSGYAIEHRKLSATQDVEGWNGPYLPTALSHGANPWGTCHLYRNVLVNDCPGFDLDADDVPEVRGAANLLYLTKIPEERARALDEALEAALAAPLAPPSVAEGPDGWARSGRVNWLPSGRLFVLLYR